MALLTVQLRAVRAAQAATAPRPAATVPTAPQASTWIRQAQKFASLALRDNISLGLRRRAAARALSGSTAMPARVTVCLAHLVSITWPLGRRAAPMSSALLEATGTPANIACVAPLANTAPGAQCQRAKHAAPGSSHRVAPQLAKLALPANISHGQPAACATLVHTASTRRRPALGSATAAPSR